MLRTFEYKLPIAKGHSYYVVDSYIGKPRAVTKFDPLLISCYDMLIMPTSCTTLLYSTISLDNISSPLPSKSCFSR